MNIVRVERSFTLSSLGLEILIELYNRIDKI